MTIKTEPEAVGDLIESANGKVGSVKNTRQSSQMDKLLKAFNLSEVKPYLTRAEITFESLKYLSKEDIKEAIPPIGLRACFREKLFRWRKNEWDIDEYRLGRPYLDDDTLSESIANKVVSWLQNQPNISATITPTSPISTSVHNSSRLSKNLKLILEDSLKGNSIINFYEKNSQLTDLLRGNLINIILEDIFYHEERLSPKDFPAIVDEIVDNFSSEIREYYFIPRGGKANPGGKLWDKYVNQRSKRIRSSVKLQDSSETSGLDCPNNNLMFDEPGLLVLKASLSEEFSNWDEVKIQWQRTFLLRQKELKISKCYEFLNDWPLYSNSRCGELINIDFELMHPNKSQNLFSKWSQFLQKIGRYYSLYIKDKKSREILTNSVGTSNQNSLDFIHIILLNAVILPTARFLDGSGKNSRKISIADSMESFIVHLTSIDDYDKEITDLREKYFYMDMTVEPIIIVVGDSIYNLEEFYVYFNNTLLKINSLLHCLDLCFKIINTLALEYPKGCRGPWVFIQEYFYEIKPSNDYKSPSICTVINYLN